MREERLETVLEQLPAGLPLPVACWMIGRIGRAIDERSESVTPDQVRVSADGSVRIAPGESSVPYYYRAPEELAGKGLTPRSTVFALGALFVETVTGRPAFQRASPMETRVAVTQDEVAPLVGRVAQATPAIDALLKRALAKDPAARFASPAELARALEAYLEDNLLEVDRHDLRVLVEPFLGGPVAAARPRPAPPANPAPAASPAPVARPAPVASPAPAPRPAPAAPVPAPASKSRGLPEPDDDLALDWPEPAAPIGAAPASPAPVAPMDRSAAPMPDIASSDAADLELADFGEEVGTATRAPAAAPAPASEPDFSGAELELDAPARPQAPRPEPRPDPRGTAPTKRVRDPALELDDHAVQQERRRPIAAGIRPDPEPEEGANWVIRMALVLVVLLALALVYQFVVRPLLATAE